MTNNTTTTSAAELAIQLHAVVKDTLEKDGDLSHPRLTEAMWLLMQMIAGPMDAGLTVNRFQGR